MILNGLSIEMLQSNDAFPMLQPFKDITGNTEDMGGVAGLITTSVSMRCARAAWPPLQPSWSWSSIGGKSTPGQRPVRRGRALASLSVARGTAAGLFLESGS